MNTDQESDGHQSMRSATRYFKRGQFGDAVILFDEACEAGLSCAEETDAIYYRSIAQAKIGQFAAARDGCRQLGTRDPGRAKQLSETIEEPGQ